MLRDNTHCQPFSPTLELWLLLMVSYLLDLGDGTPPRNGDNDKRHGICNYRYLKPSLERTNLLGFQIKR